MGEIDRFNDLSDVHEQLADESEKNTELCQKDDKDVIPKRKLHKLLCRVRFRRPAEERNETPWVFYARLGLVFTPAKHEVDTILQFASPEAPPRCHETSAEAQRRT